MRSLSGLGLALAACALTALAQAPQTDVPDSFDSTEDSSATIVTPTSDAANTTSPAEATTETTASAPTTASANETIKAQTTAQPEPLVQSDEAAPAASPPSAASTPPPPGSGALCKLSLFAFGTCRSPEACPGLIDWVNTGGVAKYCRRNAPATVCCPQ